MFISTIREIKRNLFHIITFDSCIYLQSHFSRTRRICTFGTRRTLHYIHRHSCLILHQRINAHRFSRIPSNTCFLALSDSYSFNLSSKLLLTIRINLFCTYTRLLKLVQSDRSSSAHNQTFSLFHTFAIFFSERKKSTQKEKYRIPINSYTYLPANNHPRILDKIQPTMNTLLKSANLSPFPRGV